MFVIDCLYKALLIREFGVWDVIFLPLGEVDQSCVRVHLKCHQGLVMIDDEVDDNDLAILRFKLVVCKDGDWC